MYTYILFLKTTTFQKTKQKKSQKMKVQAKIYTKEGLLTPWIHNSGQTIFIILGYFSTQNKKINN